MQGGLTDEMSYQRHVLNKIQKMDNVQTLNNFINIPSSHSFRSYLEC
jgi:hypothetical protein